MQVNGGYYFAWQSDKKKVRLGARAVAKQLIMSERCPISLYKCSQDKVMMQKIGDCLQSEYWCI